MERERPCSSYLVADALNPFFRKVIPFTNAPHFLPRTISPCRLDARNNGRASSILPCDFI